MPRLVLLGKQGAGKGTQAARLGDYYGVAHLSTGEIFRAQATQGTAFGLEAKRFMDGGELVPDAVLIGQDVESTQWVAAVAAQAGVPHLILEKMRHGDRDVRVSVPDEETLRNRTPVLVDDIISTGQTMLATLGHLRRLGARPAVCIGVHAVFADGADAALLEAGAARVVTTNTIAHPSNAIDVADLLAGGIREVLDA